MKRASVLLIAPFLIAGLSAGQSTTTTGSSSGSVGLTPGTGQGTLPGLGPALFPRVTQDDITNGSMSLKDIRTAGLRIFSTPFNKFDGMGDGPIGGGDPTQFGSRPTIGGNGTWLRVNGLDSQSCVECHFIQSSRSIPTTFAIGGVAGIAASAMPGIINFDIGDADANGIADIDGRKINPPFVFGSGGVELVAKEMTTELQVILAAAQAADDGTVFSLDTKGVNFGTISQTAGVLDTSGVEGVADDLVVRPFGRKGDNATVRKFDIGAIQFHHGIQPEEVVGTGVDADGDGVVDEIMIGELSALHIFAVASDKPTNDMSAQQVNTGFQLFISTGCADCHSLPIHTDSTMLPIAFPEVEADPSANVFLTLDLKGGSAGFKQSNLTNGIIVAMFSDLKRHDIGTAGTPGSGGLDPFFITPRLWGVADTAPYLHDGRALTITEAIAGHNGEAATVRAAYDALDVASQIELLTFLDGLRAPINPNNDLK